MQISTTARHCELDAETRQFIQQRLEKLERYALEIREAHTVITREKFRYTGEITLHVDHHELVSTESSTEARLAFELAADRIQEQLRRLKDRRLDQQQGKRAARTGTGPADATPDDSDDED